MMLEKSDRGVIGEEKLRQRVNSPSQDLQQFADTVEVFSFVDEAQENIVDLFSNEGAQSQEFSVDTMKHSFEKVTFARIFRVKELQQLWGEERS
jgi:hypothetical protein